MTSDDAPRPRRGSAEKRAAIHAAALTVFGRDGFKRAGIDTIAKEAGVSTRTIYNHYGGKEELFQDVIRSSTVRVREAQLALLDKHLRKVADLRADLVDLTFDWCLLPNRFTDHFALVRQVQAEAGHLPAELLAEWQREGPGVVQADLRRRLEGLAGRGLLDLRDGRRAAVHLLVLATAETVNRTLHGALPMDWEEIRASAEDGVDAFLRAYAPRAEPAG
ncbi:TetR/AcrR family transcriptional regulator [Nocardiopsis sp. RSe5-2]|uniref:TetR/AcrR family transcriptional regulator n=1 Tax=Nocardiopsis endophytica TaxID=3018445 RepID=A0ABT4TZA4_9ACTN|nr:TetR/AcrR family transcriptional regulator [Nocardiopsis endophytica]MDA2809569.1 TetR/AcrR family transcriptional regulator [Nocardiopsis endophytica]